MFGYKVTEMCSCSKTPIEWPLPFYDRFAGKLGAICFIENSTLLNYRWPLKRSSTLLILSLNISKTCVIRTLVFENGRKSQVFLQKR